MPNVEEHVKFCVHAFGEENRELCYMVNSWMDAPSRTMGGDHRITRHDINYTPFEACEIYGDRGTKPTPRNLLVARMVLQHLRLDGMIMPSQEKSWNWEEAVKNVQKRKQVTNQFFNYILPSKEIILHKAETSYRSSNIIFKNISIYDAKEQDVYWRRVINHIGSKAIEKYGKENVNASITNDGYLWGFLRWGLEPVLVNILVNDNAFSRGTDRKALEFYSRISHHYKDMYGRSNGYILGLMVFRRFFSIPRGFRAVNDGILVRSSINAYDIDILKKFMGKESLRILKRLNVARDKNPELEDLAIFVGRDFSGLVSLPLEEKDLLNLKHNEVFEKMLRKHRTNRVESLK